MISAAGIKDQELAVERLGGGLSATGAEDQRRPSAQGSGAMNELFAMEYTSCQPPVYASLLCMPASCV
jgi:hypothetical protein